MLMRCCNVLGMENENIVNGDQSVSCNGISMLLFAHDGNISVKLAVLDEAVTEAFQYVVYEMKKIERESRKMKMERCESVQRLLCFLRGVNERCMKKINMLDKRISREIAYWNRLDSERAKQVECGIRMLGDIDVELNMKEVAGHMRLFLGGRYLLLYEMYGEQGTDKCRRILEMSARCDWYADLRLKVVCANIIRIHCEYSEEHKEMRKRINDSCKMVLRGVMNSEK